MPIDCRLNNNMMCDIPEVTLQSGFKEVTQNAKCFRMIVNGFNSTCISTTKT